MSVNPQRPNSIVEALGYLDPANQGAIAQMLLHPARRPLQMWSHVSTQNKGTKIMGFWVLLLRRLRVASSPIGNVRRDRAYDLQAISMGGVKDGAATNAIDRHPINQVGVSPVLPGANVARKKTQGMGGGSGESKPPDFGPNLQEAPTWEEWYRVLWQKKLAGLKQDHC